MESAMIPQLQLLSEVEGEDYFFCFHWMELIILWKNN